MREQAGIFRDPGPVDTIEDCVRKLGDRLVIEMLAACEDAAEQ